MGCRQVARALQRRYPARGARSIPYTWVHHPPSRHSFVYLCLEQMARAVNMLYIEIAVTVIHSVTRLFNCVGLRGLTLHVNA